MLQAPANRAPRRASRWALFAAVLCLTALAATWVLAALVPATHLRDAVVLRHFIALDRPRIDWSANLLLHLLDPLSYTLWACMIVLVALLRRRVLLALTVALVLPAAPLTAELLKPLMAHPHAYILPFKTINSASWPSGHATAAMTLVLCALLVAPRRLRPALAALGGLFVVAVGVSLVVLAWHMPSDVLGGYLLAGLYASLATAALYARPVRSTPPQRSPLSEPDRRRVRPGSIATPAPHPLHGRG